MDDLTKALAVTAELCGTDLSEGAAAVLVEELAGYDRALIMGALRRVRREHKGRLTMAAILERIEDGRPGPDEAWSMLPQSERDSVVWTQEMQTAWAPISHVEDMRAMRPAFLERHKAEVAKARDAGVPVQWSPSLGWDPVGREVAIRLAAQLGRLGVEHAEHLLPEPMAAESARVHQAFSGVVRVVK
jgi:hypothetical protein